MRNYAVLRAIVKNWPPRDEMIRILRESGLSVSSGKYSITVNDCSYFKFEEYGGDLGSPCIVADAGDAKEMIKDALLVSNALAKGSIFHSFEIYDYEDNLVQTIKHGNNF